MKRLLVLSVLAAVVCLSGCGGGKGGAGIRGHKSASRAVHISARARHTVALRSVKQAEIYAPSVSWLSYYDGSIWAKRDDGHVIRVDPSINKRTGILGFTTDQEHYCQGIGAGGGAVWSCQKGFITRIDPMTAKIVARVPIVKAFDQGRYVYAHGRIWVITGTNGNQLTGIDTATNQPGHPIALPYTCQDLAPGGDAVWVLCGLEGRVVKVDVKKARVVGTIKIPSL